MKQTMRRMGAWSLFGMWAVLPISPAEGEITEVSGSVAATVVQFHQGQEIQRDFSQHTVPQTVTAVPAVARARLDRLLPDGNETAAGQAVAVLDNPMDTTLGSRNDVGLDLGAFSDDAVSSWMVDGVVHQRRTLIISSADVGGELARGTPTDVESRLVLSGVMLITALDTGQDLTGVSSRFEFAITRPAPDQDPAASDGEPAGQAIGQPEDSIHLLGGTVVLAGGPDGAVTIESATGAFANIPLSLSDFSDVGGGLPLARAIIFTGLQFDYGYTALVGEPIVLELWVGATVEAAPNGTGAAAVFGTPVDGIASILDRVKRDDRGQHLASLIAQRVDTTGEAYRNGSGTTAAPFPFFFPLCGFVGLETVGLVLMSCCLMLVRRGRRRRAGPAAGR